MDSPKTQYPTTLVPVNKKDPKWEGGHSTKIGGMWSLIHNINPQKLYELLIKTELKDDTSLYHNNF